MPSRQIPRASLATEAPTNLYNVAETPGYAGFRRVFPADLRQNRFVMRDKSRHVGTQEFDPGLDLRTAELARRVDRMDVHSLQSMDRQYPNRRSALQARQHPDAHTRANGDNERLGDVDLYRAAHIDQLISFRSLQQPLIRWKGWCLEHKAVVPGEVDWLLRQSTRTQVRGRCTQDIAHHADW